MLFINVLVKNHNFKSTDIEMEQRREELSHIHLNFKKYSFNNIGIGCSVSKKNVTAAKRKFLFYACCQRMIFYCFLYFSGSADGCLSDENKLCMSKCSL